MENLVFPNNISAFELKSKLLQEGDKRMKYLASGFLVDPEGRAVSQEVTYKIKED
jgi:hypothetical protein